MNNGKSETGMATDHTEQVSSKEEAVGEREYFRSVQKMVDAIDKNKMLVERVMGSTDFDWSFVKLSFEGTVLKPTELTAFDKAVCGVLLIKGTLDKMGLALVLGFDIKNDAAERDLFDKEIESLADVGTIEGDDSVLWLTEKGKEFARRGEKIKTFNEKFELYMDSFAGFKHEVITALQKLDVKEAQNDGDQLFGGETVFEESEDNEEDGEVDGSVFRDITDAAAVQAPEVHFPSKMFFLKQCKLVGKKYFLTRLKVVLLENFRDGTNRGLVYDEKNGCILEPLSEVFSHSEEQMKLVFEKIQKESFESESPIEGTDEEKSDEQIEYEQAQIEKQEELDQAIASGDQITIAKIVDQAIKGKTLFSTLEFEREIDRLLGESSGEIWIQGTWIKNAKLRLTLLFEAFLKRGGRLFIAYLASEKPNDIMCNEEPLSKLQELETQYPQFYLCELPHFHTKQLWLKGHSLYNGSYDILSFHSNLSEAPENVRQEFMTKTIWDESCEKLYHRSTAHFGLKYLKEGVQKFDELCRHENISLDRNFLKEVADFKIDKLDFFVNKKLDQFDAKYESWLSYRKSKFADLQAEFCKQEILKIHAELDAEAQKSVNQVISIKKLNELEKRLGAFCKEFPESETFAQKSSLQDSLSEYRERFYKNQIEQLFKAVDVPKNEIIPPERLKGYKKGLDEIVAAFPKAGSWAEKSKIEKLVAELLERFYRSEFSRINEEIQNTSDADFRKKDLANFKNRLKKLSEEFPAVDDWLQKAGTESLLKGKYERAYKLLILQLLKEVKKLGEGSFEKKQLTEFQSRLKSICSEFPEAEVLPEKSEIELVLKELLIRSYRNNLLNFRKEIEPEQGEILPPSKIKDFRNRLNALAKEIPDELVGEAVEIDTLLDDRLLNYYKHRITLLAKDIEAKGDTLVPPAEFHEFQNRLDEVLKNCKEAEGWDETRNIKVAIEGFRERHYRSVLSKILEEIKSLGDAAKNRAKEFRKRKENILRDFPSAINWQETIEIDELLKPKGNVQ